jgi:hypothetical protein
MGAAKVMAKRMANPMAKGMAKWIAKRMAEGMATAMPPDPDKYIGRWYSDHWGFLGGFGGI